MSSGIGQALRSARHQTGRSLKDVSVDTKIRETYLAALEAEEFEALGETVYARGFLANYAKYLGLDPDDLVEAYRTHHEKPDEPLPPAPRPILDRDPRRQRTAVLSAIAGVVTVVVLVWLWLGRGAGDEAAALAVIAPLVVARSWAPRALWAPRVSRTQR